MTEPQTDRNTSTQNQSIKERLERNIVWVALAMLISGAVGAIGFAQWINQQIKDQVNNEVKLAALDSIGPRGDKGDKGDKGDMGPQGIAGAAGPPGVNGERGAQGPMGPQGPAGQMGKTGAAGRKGDRGDVGPAGPRGFSGKDAVFNPNRLRHVNCTWVKVHPTINSHQPKKWCPDGSFLTGLDLDGGGFGTRAEGDYPVVGQAYCCRLGQ